MKLLLDTTYLLPAIGVAVRGLPRTVVRDLRERGHSISICTITIFELAAKGAKFVRDGKLKEDGVRHGLQAILNDEAISQVQFQEPEVLARAMAIRAELNDFIDCLILCSAVTTADALVSEDGELQDTVSQENIRAKLKPINAAFNVYSSRKVPDTYRASGKLSTFKNGDSTGIKLKLTGSEEQRKVLDAREGGSTEAAIRLI